MHTYTIMVSWLTWNKGYRLKGKTFKAIKANSLMEAREAALKLCPSGAEINCSWVNYP